MPGIRRQIHISAAVLPARMFLICRPSATGIGTGGKTKALYDILIMNKACETTVDLAFSAMRTLSKAGTIFETSFGHVLFTREPEGLGIISRANRNIPCANGIISCANRLAHEIIRFARVNLPLARDKIRIIFRPMAVVECANCLNTLIKLNVFGTSDDLRVKIG